jgi:hypothetical protein
MQEAAMVLMIERLGGDFLTGLTGFEGLTGEKGSQELFRNPENTVSAGGRNGSHVRKSGRGLFDRIDRI